jgi:hypothetical protein
MDKNCVAKRNEGRELGEMFYQQQQELHRQHQVRISEAQMQQSYYSLGVVPQGTHFFF